jgi:hypothetical protein
MYHSRKRFTYRNTPGLLYLRGDSPPGVCHTSEQAGVNIGDKIFVYARGTPPDPTPNA